MFPKSRRMWYLAGFFALLMVEICLGLFVHDRFFRPYVGDVLVTALLCCLARVVAPRFSPALPVFLFSATVEAAQWLQLGKRLGLEGTMFGLILGATADWRDLICYGIGCLAFYLTERLFTKHEMAIGRK